MKTADDRLDVLLDPLSPPFTVRSLLHEKYAGRLGWDSELNSVREMTPIHFAGFVSALLRGVKSQDVLHDVLQWSDKVKAARVVPSVKQEARAA